MKILGIAIALTLLSLTLWGQTPSLVLTGPEQTLMNQEVCMKALFSNTDDVGFQPYIRVLIPPELASVTDGTLFGEEISGITYHGAVTEPTKADPNIPQAYPDLRNFAAPLGDKYYNIEPEHEAELELGIEREHAEHAVERALDDSEGSIHNPVGQPLGGRLEILLLKRLGGAVRRVQQPRERDDERREDQHSHP